MWDIYCGLGIVIGLAAITFFVFLAIGRHLSHSTLNLLALGVVLAFFLYVELVWQNVRLVRWLPYSNLIVVGNWFPVGAAALGALVWRHVSGHLLRKSVAILSLMLVSGYSLIDPVIGSSPECGDQWENGICVQTTEKTCSPACAATLLNWHGVACGEDEMARLCLTRQGTTWMGLYRALKLKTAGTPWDVEVLDCPVDQLPCKEPLILTVGLPRASDKERETWVNEWGWKPGVRHTVILMRESQHDGLLIGDPTPGIGREEWRWSDLRYLYRGTALRLVRRSGKSGASPPSCAVTRLTAKEGGHR